MFGLGCQAGTRFGRHHTVVGRMHPKHNLCDWSQLFHWITRTTVYIWKQEKGTRSSCNKCGNPRAFLFFSRHVIFAIPHSLETFLLHRLRPPTVLGRVEALARKWPIWPFRSTLTVCHRREFLLYAVRIVRCTPLPKTPTHIAETMHECNPTIFSLCLARGHARGCTVILHLFRLHSQRHQMITYIIYSSIARSS